MTQPKTASKFTPEHYSIDDKTVGIPVGYDELDCFPIYDDAGSVVALVSDMPLPIGKIRARLFWKAPEMYELLELVNKAKDNILSIEKSEGKFSMSTLFPSPTILDWSDIVDLTRRIKAEIDGRELLKLYEEEKP